MAGSGGGVSGMIWVVEGWGRGVGGGRGRRGGELIWIGWRYVLGIAMPNVKNPPLLLNTHTHTRTQNPLKYIFEIK